MAKKMGYLDTEELIEARDGTGLVVSDQDPRSDEEVLLLSIDDPRHFEVIVDRYHAPFARNVRKILGSREEVDDVVQEAFTKIYFNAHRFEKVEGAKFSSWAYKILLNTSFTYYKKLKRKEDFHARIDDEIWEIIPDVNANDLQKKEVRDTVIRALSRMPEPMARILSMHFIEDRPQAEIAEIEGVSISAVKTRIHRAKKEFKKINLGMI